MEAEKREIYIIDGRIGQRWLSLEDRFCHLRLEELMKDGLPQNSFTIFDCKLEELNDVLGAFFRQKRPFALAGIDDIQDENGLARLCETAVRKKSRAWVLGGLRVHPVVASAKEIITGGCLGELTALSVKSGFERSAGETIMVHDAAAWMCGALATNSTGGIVPEIESAHDDGRLEITANGTAGELFAEYDSVAGKGSLMTNVNHHRRTRLFGAADACMMELNLLAALAPTMTTSLPGLVPLRELAITIERKTRIK